MLECVQLEKHITPTVTTINNLIKHLNTQDGQNTQKSF